MSHRAYTVHRDFLVTQEVEKAYNLEIGLLINFGSKRLEFHRFTNKKYNPTLLHHPDPSQQSQTSQFRQ